MVPAGAKPHYSWGIHSDRRRRRPSNQNHGERHGDHEQNGPSGDEGRQRGDGGGGGDHYKPGAQRQLKSQYRPFVCGRLSLFPLNCAY